MNKFFVLTLLLVLFGVVIASLPHFREFRRRHADGVLHLLTMLATFAGVFGGIYFADLQKKSDERKAAAELYAVLETDLDDALRRNAMGLALLIAENTYHKPIAAPSRYFVFPTIGLSFLTDKDALKNFTPRGLSLLRLQSDLLPQFQDDLQTIDTSTPGGVDEWIAKARTICITFAYLKQLLGYERAVAAGDMSKDSINSMHELFMKDFLSGYDIRKQIPTEQRHQYVSYSSAWLRALDEFTAAHTRMISNATSTTHTSADAGTGEQSK
jgi:hypothetical protein